MPPITPNPKAKDVRAVVACLQKTTGAPTLPYLANMTFVRQFTHDDANNYKLLVGKLSDGDVYAYLLDGTAKRQHVQYWYNRETHDNGSVVLLPIRIAWDEIGPVQFIDPFSYLPEPDDSKPNLSRKLSAFVKACFIMKGLTKTPIQFTVETHSVQLSIAVRLIERKRVSETDHPAEGVTAPKLTRATNKSKTLHTPDQAQIKSEEVFPRVRTSLTGGSIPRVVPRSTTERQPEPHSERTRVLSSPISGRRVNEERPGITNGASSPLTLPNGSPSLQSRPSGSRQASMSRLKKDNDVDSIYGVLSEAAPEAPFQTEANGNEGDPIAAGLAESAAQRRNISLLKQAESEDQILLNELNKLQEEQAQVQQRIRNVEENRTTNKRKIQERKRDIVESGKRMKAIEHQMNEDQFVEWVVRKNED